MSCLKNFARKISRVGRFIWTLLTSHCGLLIILVGYSFAGAAIMRSIEDYFIKQQSIANNLTNGTNITDFKQYFAQVLLQDSWNGTELKIEVGDVEKLLILYELEQEKHRKEFTKPKQYDYWEWLLFCLTVYSTIGKCYDIIITLYHSLLLSLLLVYITHISLCQTLLCYITPITTCNFLSLISHEGAKISRPIVVGGGNFFFSILFGGAIFFTHYFCELFFAKVTLHVL